MCGQVNLILFLGPKAYALSGCGLSYQRVNVIVYLKFEEMLVHN